MPEYSQIQTAIKYDRATFGNTVILLENFFIDIGFDKLLITDWLNKFVWVVEENGFVYSGYNMSASKFHFKDEFELSLRPIILGMSQKELNLPYDILIIEILLETEQVFDYSIQKYKYWVYDIIEKITVSLSRYFTEYGIYFTDEVSDMRPIDSLIFNDDKYLWYFDFALLPEKLASKYLDLPINYISKKLDKNLIFYSTVFPIEHNGDS